MKSILPLLLMLLSFTFMACKTKKVDNAGINKIAIHLNSEVDARSFAKKYTWLTYDALVSKSDNIARFTLDQLSVEKASKLLRDDSEVISTPKEFIGNSSDKSGKKETVSVNDKIKN